MDDFFDYSDLDSLIDDLTSEDVPCSVEELPVLEAVVEKKVKKGNTKKSRRTSYNQVQVRQNDPSQLVVFTPKIVKSDIRRSYASMIANVINSGDFPLMFGMLETFFTPNFEHCVVKHDPGALVPQSFVQQGLWEIATSFYAIMHMDPDPRVSLKDTKIHLLSNTTASKIVTEWSFSATSIYERDGETSPTSSRVEEIQESTNLNHVDNDTRTKSNSDDMGNIISTTTNADQLSTISTIARSIEAVKKTFPLRSEPMPFTLGGLLVLYTDENKVITRMEMEMLAEPSDAGSVSQLNLVQPTLARFSS